MRRMPGAKLRWLACDTGPAPLPVGLVAFGEGGRPYVRFVEGDARAASWQSLVERCRERGALRPEVLAAWEDMCRGDGSGAGAVIERVDIEVPDGTTEQQAFDRLWDDVFEEWVVIAIEAMHLAAAEP